MCTIAALALSGCGGGTKEDPAKVLDQTFSGKRTVRSGKVKVRVAVDAKGLSGVNGPVTITLTGPFERPARQLPKFDLDTTLTAGGRTLAVGAVSTGDKGFIKFQGSAYAVPDTIFAGFKQGFEQARSTSPGIDPRKWMRHPSVEGDEEVAGEATTHVSSDIDVPKLLDDRARILQKANQLGVARNRQVSTNLTAAQKKAVVDTIEHPRFDVYSGKHDRILRKLTVAFAFNVPAKQQQRANGLKSGRVTVDVELADVNRPEPTRAPTKLKPFSELRSALSILAGLPGLGLLVSPSQVSSTAPGPGPAAATNPSGAAGGSGSVQAYAQCVTAAGGDPSKEQACAGLLPSR
ncbi:MAG: hypothetical protein M3Z33_10560 [Actinomycetota bacterium]|nr:hypothetical protein [Actinomycetota bacterium]